MKLLGKLSQYDKIANYMKDPSGDISTLSDHDKNTLDRWMEAFTLMRNYNSYADATAILRKRFPGLSRATAYRDCANAISLFGDFAKASKDGIKHLTTEMVSEAYGIARAKNNEDGMTKAALAIARINGVNTTDPDLPDFDQLEPHEYVIGLPPAYLSVIEQMISGGRVDLTDMSNAMAAVAEDAIIVNDTQMLSHGQSESG